MFSLGPVANLGFILFNKTFSAPIIAARMMARNCMSSLLATVLIKLCVSSCLTTGATAPW